MTKIYQVSGIGASRPARKLFTVMNRDIGEITEGEMDLLIARDNMVTKRDIVAGIKGIGSLKAQKFQNTIDVLDDALYGLTTPDPVAYMAAIEEDILAGEFSQEHQVSGIGCPNEIGRIRKFATDRRRTARAKRMQKELIAGIGKAKKPKTKTGAFLKKAAQKVAPALKKVVKAANPINQAKAAGKVLKKAGGAVKKAAKKAAPVLKKLAQNKVLRAVVNPAGAVTRLAVKGILEITLPKAAPFFLYLFINDPAIIAKLPAKVKRKRDRQVKIKNFIVNVIGMKDSHFMGIVRNGIMKQMGASPETILSRSIKGISGIGADPYTTAIMFVIQLISKLIQLFKKKPEGGEAVTADDAPSDSDFAESTEAEKAELSTEVKKQNDLPEPSEDTPANPVRSQTESAASNNDVREYSSSGSNNTASSASSSSSNASYSEENSDGSASSENTSQPSATKEPPSGTDETGEIQKNAASKDYATGGRKGWNSLG